MSAQKNILLAALILLPVAAGAIFLATGDAERDSDSNATARGERRAEADSAAEALEPLPGDETQALPQPGSDPTRLAVTGTEVDAAAAELGWEPAESQWIEGMVQFQDGLPATSGVFVMALPRELARVRLYRKDGPAADAWKWKGRATEELLNVVEVGPDGGFRIAFPPHVHSGWLAVTGDYVYSYQTKRVQLPAAGEPVTLVAELGALLTGRLLPPPGVELGQDVFAETEMRLEIDIMAAGVNPMEMTQEAVARRVDTDEAGHFAFRGVPTKDPMQMVALPKHFAMQQVNEIQVAPGEHRVIDVQLDRGGAILGRVVDQQGVGVHEAEISVRRPGLDGQIIGSLRETLSGVDGSFELEAVAAGRAIVEAERKGYLDARLELQSLVSEGAAILDQELVLDRGRTVAGRVRFADGKPAAEAAVRIAPDYSSGNPYGGGMPVGSNGYGTTDDKGRFEISGLSQGTYVVSASLELDSGSREGLWQARRDGYRPDDTEVQLTLEEPVTLRGLVTDVEGLPVTSFAVAAKVKGSGGVFEIGAETKEGEFEPEDGTFALADLRAGTWIVSVRAHGYGKSEPLEIELPSAQPLPVVLQPSARVSGLVVDNANRPVKNAVVRLELSLAKKIAAAASGQLGFARTDAEGRFLLEELDPGSFSILAKLEGFACSEATPIEVEPGAQVEGIVLQLRLGGTIRGTVFGPDGEPAGGQEINFVHLQSYDQHLIHSESDGTFRREHLEPGKWQIVSKPNLIEASSAGAADPEGQDLGDIFSGLSTTIEDLADGQELVIELGAPPKDPVTILGRVLAAGEPVPNAMISFLPGDQAGSNFSSIKLDTSDEDGRFELELEAPGNYLATVQVGMQQGTQNSVEFQEQIPKDQAEYTLVFDMPGGKISGRVTDDDGDPLVHARITLNLDGGVRCGTFLGGHYTEMYTDAAGEYEIPFLGAGQYSVGAGGVAMGGAFGGDTAGGREIRTGLVLGEGKHLAGVDFRLSAPGDITGVVRDTNGKAVAGAAIFVRDEAGALLERLSLVTSDSGGHFEYRGIQAGTYSLMARADGMSSPETGPVRVQAGETAKQDLVLDQGTVLYVSLLDRQGEEVRGTISVIDAKGHEVTGMLSVEDLVNGMEGFLTSEQRVGPLAPGKYKVSASLDDGRSASKPVTLSSDQEERRVKLRLK